MSQQLLDVRDHALVANVAYRLQISGRFFQVTELSQDVDITFLRGNSRIGVATGAPDGFSFGPLSEERKFHEVQILSTINQTCRIAIANDEAFIQRLVGSFTATLTKATVFDSIADVNLPATATTLILAADANRRVVTITNLSASVVLRIGDNGAGAADGTPLDAGASIDIEGEGAIYAYNPSGAAVLVAVSQVKD